MNNRNFIIAIKLLLFLTIDIFVVSRFELGSYFIPHIYFLSIISLPVRTSKAVMLLFAFFTGLIVDLFMNTGGLHASASVMMAFVRLFTLRMYINPEDEDNNISPGLYTLGNRKYIIYASVLILVHQLTFFTMEVFKMDSFFLILKKTFASTLLDILLVLFIQMASKKPTKKNERRKR